MESINTAVILAGGMGTRLAPYTDTNPKPMYPFNDKPFLEYLVIQVKSFGIKKIVLLLGYKAEKIVQYFDDGSKWDVEIVYDITPVEYNTADRIVHAGRLIVGNFLLMYCDNYCPIDFRQLISDFNTNQADIQITVYENKDGYTKSNMIIEDGHVAIYDKTRKTPDLQGVDIGYAVVREGVIDSAKALIGDIPSNKNFEAVMYPELVRNKKLYATVTKHRYYSVGSWERIELTKTFFDNKKTIFLDRDGTINKRPPKACYVEKAEDFIWLGGAIEAIRKLKDSGYRIILVSNQPGIARGMMSEGDLEAIHRKMENDLKEQTQYEIDSIYYCPHGWDEGCECRKPKPGMLYQAQKDFSLDLTKCILIGDDDRDIEAGNAAGCKCYQVTDDETLLDIVVKRIGL